MISRVLITLIHDRLQVQPYLTIVLAEGNGDAPQPLAEWKATNLDTVRLPTAMHDGVIGCPELGVCFVGRRSRAHKIHLHQADAPRRPHAENLAGGESPARQRPFIRHRTGHSLSPGAAIHGLGMNLDNLETHDTREMLAGIGFTIEPGLYFPDFGVRLEINLYVDPQWGPVVTSCTQDEPLVLG